MIICLVALAVVVAFAWPHLRAGSRVLTPTGERVVGRVGGPLRPLLAPFSAVRRGLRRALRPATRTMGGPARAAGRRLGSVLEPVVRAVEEGSTVSPRPVAGPPATVTGLPATVAGPAATGAEQPLPEAAASPSAPPAPLVPWLATGQAAPREGRPGAVRPAEVTPSRLSSYGHLDRRRSSRSTEPVVPAAPRPAHGQRTGPTEHGGHQQHPAPVAEERPEELQPFRRRRGRPGDHSSLTRR